MKILNLSLDKSILDANSKTAKRIVEFSDMTDKYAIVVPAKDSKEIKLSEKVFVYGSGGSNKIFQLINVYRTAKKLLKQKNFDIITVQDQYYLALIGWLLAKKFKIGLELQIHGFERYSGFRKVIANFVIPRANAIRCVSQRLKKQLINELGVKEERIMVAPIYTEIRNPKSEIRNKFQNESFNYKNNKFIFLTVGRLVPVKNIGLQIKAMAEVVKKYLNVKLWIAGDGQEISNLKSQISNLKLENNIKFLGWQNNLEEFYRQADAFLLTSNYEGWGMAVVEAASYGLPIIMTDVGCAGELIENEKSGLVIPINDQIKLEETMIIIINNTNLRQKLAEGALLAVKNLPSKEQTMVLYKQSWEKAKKKIKLLIITQKVDINDPILGFFHRWVEEFAKHCEQVTVIALVVGKYHLPANVRVFSLGKELGAGRVRRLFNFYRLIWRERKKYDVVFVHMNPEYMILGGLIWCLTGKHVSLWYSHKSVDLKLRIASLFVHDIFTASKESFRLRSKKVHVMGHGIDTNFFAPDDRVKRESFILSVGRLSPIKRHDLVIEIATREGVPLHIAGEGEERGNLESLVHKIGANVVFLGALNQVQLRDEYRRTTRFVHRSETGSLDKVVLEAAACGCPVDTADPALVDVPFSSSYIREHHGLPALVLRILSFYETTNR